MAEQYGLDMATAQEIARQLVPRAEAQASILGRAHGTTDANDDDLYDAWMTVDETVDEAMLLESGAAPDPWTATFARYPKRQGLLMAAIHQHPDDPEAMVRLARRMRQREWKEMGFDQDIPPGASPFPPDGVSPDDIGALPGPAPDAMRPMTVPDDAPSGAHAGGAPASMRPPGGVP